MLSNRRVRIEKNIVVRIYRGLPGKGSLNIAEGAEVIPSDILGVFEVSSGFKIVDVASVLSVAPADISKYLKRKIGERIYKGELLAQKTAGLFGGGKIVTASSDSTIDLINTQTGQVRLSILPKKVNLPAGVYGIVEKVDKARSKVLIRTQASRVYGVLGTGRIREGILHNLGSRERLIVPSMILPDMSDKILLGGGVIYKDAISIAISSGVCGVITGGINAVDYKSVAGGRILFPKKLDTDIGTSLIATEGFGSIPIGEDIYGLLSTMDGKFVTIDGNAGMINLPSYDSSSMDLVKRTKLPPLLEGMPLAESKEVEVGEAKIGMMVRVVGNAYLGEQGKIVAIDRSESLLPSNAKAIIVTLETKRRKIQIPINNIEIL